MYQGFTGFLGLSRENPWLAGLYSGYSQKTLIYMTRAVLPSINGAHNTSLLVKKVKLLTFSLKKRAWGLLRVESVLFSALLLC